DQQQTRTHGLSSPRVSLNLWPGRERECPSGCWQVERCYLMMKGRSPVRSPRNCEETQILTGPNVILVLKVAVAGVTGLLLASLVALRRGNYRLHGRINLVFFGLTAATLVGFEGIIRVMRPELFDY